MAVTNRVNIRLRKDKRLMLRLNGMIIETVAGREMHLKRCAAVVHQEANGSILFCYFKGFDPRTLYGVDIIRGSDFRIRLPQDLYLKRPGS